MRWLVMPMRWMCARNHARIVLGILSVITLGCAVGGCSTGPQNMAAFAQAGSGPTVSFESIDGPPAQVFDRLVNALNTEAIGKPVTVVAHDAPASYHVRGYLSAQVKRGRSVIAWVFDAYDGNQQRAFRLTGEEAAGKAGRDAWSAADDQVLRRIAQAGLSGLAAYVGGGTPPEAPAEPDARGPVVASADAAMGGTLSARPLGFSNH